MFFHPRQNSRHHIARSLWSSAWWPFTEAQPSWVGHVQGMGATGASSFFRRADQWGMDGEVGWKIWKILVIFSGLEIGFFQEFLKKCISRWNHRVNVTFRDEFHFEMWCERNSVRQNIANLCEDWEDRLILRQKRGYLSIETTGWVRFWGCFFFFKDQPGGLQTWWNVAGHGMQLVWTRVRGLRIEMSRVFLNVGNAFFFSVLGLEGWWEYKETEKICMEYIQYVHRGWCDRRWLSG